KQRGPPAGGSGWSEEGSRIWRSGGGSGRRRTIGTPRRVWRELLGRKEGKSFGTSRLQSRPGEAARNVGGNVHSVSSGRPDRLIVSNRTLFFQCRRRARGRGGRSSIDANHCECWSCND